MKKILNFALTALLVGGLSLAATSCKDDDDDNGDNEENMELWESTGSSLSMEDSQLSSLIASFADVQESELLQTNGWKQKTYEAVLGLVLDESRPTVRSIEVGTLVNADERALTLLNSFCIDGSNPSGFTYSNAEVGTVSYRHGGGTDANTLAVIDINVKQLPGISQLRMVKELPSNAATFGYYSQGDIVRKDGRLWICTTPALKEGDYAYFITLRNTHRTESCNWGTYKDYVYNHNDPMADYTQVAIWLNTFMMSKEHYDEVISHLQQGGVSSAEEISQLVPATNAQRLAFIKHLYYEPDSIPVEPLNLSEWISKNWWDNTPKTNGRYCSPHGLLLANKFRYAYSPCEYWVPFVSWTKGSDQDAMIEKLRGLASQVGTRNGEHFQHHISTKESIRDIDIRNEFVTSEYNIVVAAVYWRHSYYNGNQWAMFNFTQDWAEHPWLEMQITNNPWVSRNVTTSKLDFIDTGEPNPAVEAVWVKKKGTDIASTIRNDEVKLYSIIGTNGKFYDNVDAATDDGTEAMAFVTYLGDKKRVEKGQEWNGLAMALEEPKYNMYSTLDEESLTKEYEPQQTVNDFTGWATTQTLVREGSSYVNYQAAKICNNYGNNKRMTARQTEFSSWFLPSYGQWVLAATAMGYKHDFKDGKPVLDYVDEENHTQQEEFEAAGLSDLYPYLAYHYKSNDPDQLGIFWTSTNMNEEMAYTFSFLDSWENDKDTKKPFLWQQNKMTNNAVMPFIAFKYGGGATEDQ